MASPEFLRWCDSSLIKRYGIQAGFVGHAGWRGIIATHDIEPGQIILEVPEAVLMTRRSALRDKRLEAALTRHPGLGPVQVLGAHLLMEVSRSQRKVAASAAVEGHVYADAPAGSSPWQLYLEQLPRHYTNLCNWSLGDIESLQVTHAQEAAKSAVEEVEEQWRSVCPLLRDIGLPLKFLGFAAWLWTQSTLMSRTMYVPFDPIGGALTPFGDLHNYLPPPPPFTPDILKGLGHAKEALVPTKTAQQFQPVSSSKDASFHLKDHPKHQQPSADTLGSHLVESLADEASAGPDQEGSRGSTHQVGSRSPAETCLMAATRPQESEASDTSETAVDDREVGDGHFDEDSGVYRLVARRRYKKGEEVYLCYGRHTNLELLEHYGFLLLDNPHDTALLPVPLVLRWAELGGGHGLSDTSLRATDSFIHADGRPSWGLMLALRTLASSPGERRRSGHLLVAGERISLSGDLRAMVWLRGACLEHLKSLPTTLAEDQGLLDACVADEAARKKEDPNSHFECLENNNILALQWRMCQKRILLRAVLEAERCDSILSSYLTLDEADRIRVRVCSMA